MLRMLARLAALVLLLGASLLVDAAGPLPPSRMPFRTYGIEHGLDTLAATSLLQDQKGFLWVGLEQTGLARYDGHRFTSFGMSHGLPSVDVLCLAEDRAGTIWVGTRRGLAVWNGRRFQNPWKRLPAVRTEALLVDESGRLWVGTAQGLYTQAGDGDFDPIPGWPGREVTALVQGPLGERVVAGMIPGPSSSRPAVFRQKEAGWEELTSEDAFRGQRLDALARDRYGVLWARSTQRLWRLLPGATQFTASTLPETQPGPRGFLGLSRAGEVWVGAYQNLWRPSDGGWLPLGRREGLPSESLKAVLEDREGNLWVSGVGLFRSQGRGMLAIHSSREGLPNDTIWSFHRDRRGTLWVGSNGGLTWASAHGWKTVPGTENTVIRSIVEDASGRLLVGGNFPAVLRYDPVSNRLERFPIPQVRPSKRTYRLLVDRHDTLWVATEGAGLFTAPCAAARLEFRPEPLPGADVSERTVSVAEDREGRILVSGDRGLFLRTGTQWTRYGKAAGLRHDDITYVRCRPDGEILLAYLEPLGITRVRLQGERLEILGHVDQGSGLASNKVFFMDRDAAGRLWVGTGKGVDILGPTGIDHFGSLDGLPSEDCNAMAILPEQDGRMWIGTSGGIARFETALYRDLPRPPQPRITRVLLGREDQPPEPGRTQEVSARANVLEIDFTTPIFGFEGQIQHEIRLLGLESEWHATTIREARFPGLTPGEYTFQVRARIGRGAWGPERSWTFRIQPAWYQTVWFRGLVILALGGMGAGLVWMRIRFVEHRARRLEVLVQEKTMALQQANEALRNQSLTDPMTGLRNRRYLGECMAEDTAQVVRVYRNIRRGLLSRVEVNIDLLFLMVDIDHFKAVNDQYGHHAGDLVLQHVAEILRHATRDSDTVVRWGGEEFLVVARNACRKDAVIVAERIRSQMEGSAIDLGGGVKLQRTCSIGFALYPFRPDYPDLLNWEQVVDLADQCLYRAKHTGRNAWVGVFPSDSPLPTHLESTQLEVLEAAGLISLESYAPNTPGPA